jgi:hypothetical protein
MATDQGGILWLKVIGKDHGVMYVGDSLWDCESKNHSIQSLYVEYCVLYFTVFRTYRIPLPRVGTKQNGKGKKFKRKISLNFQILLQARNRQALLLCGRNRGLLC